MSSCRRLIEIDDGVYELPDLAIKVLARSCRAMHWRSAVSLN